VWKVKSENGRIAALKTMFDVSDIKTLREMAIHRYVGEHEI